MLVVFRRIAVVHKNALQKTRSSCAKLPSLSACSRGSHFKTNQPNFIVCSFSSDMEGSKRRKGADGGIVAQSDDDTQEGTSSRRSGTPHPSDVRAQEGPNFSVTAEATVPDIKNPMPLPEALMLLLPHVYDTKSSAKKVAGYLPHDAFPVS